MRTPMRRFRRVIAAAAILLASAATAHAQVGQSAMAPAAGLVNRAVAGFSELNATGPGWFYYGLNAADRGLGYNGSYMTLGGFIPMSEDDLGGFWAADLRGHLSEYGGFFSNVGAVRKQFLGGTLLGIGVYWDYDGDQNQYPTAGISGTEQYGQFGHAYNQVGVSAEWLTDYGNLRSNGYIPVGTTAYTVGAPGYGFVGNNLLCQYGLDAALTGADLEVGAYIPGLADWAGMISVGGYALGNSRYDWQAGSSEAGNDVVPWFGGVYTRLDMTFLQNWDFSLQANNDSYFDWTGFARLTYRMGGSRRRNVPDQMEQPMMRNEHIVRAHQTPIVAINPDTGRPWNVIHVDNSASIVGAAGTNENPWTTLAAAQADATEPFDIVFVRPGISGTTPYTGNWQFQADNQILVGAGSMLQLDTSSCGYREFFNTGTTGPFPIGTYPVLALSGTGIRLRNGAIVDHLDIRNAAVGIAADASLTTVAYVNDVKVSGSNGAAQVGVQLADVDGTVNLYNMELTNTGRGLWVDGGSGDVQFQGVITSNGSPGELLLVQNKTGGGVAVNTTSDTLDAPLARNTAINASFGISGTNSQVAAAVAIAGNTNTEVSVGPTLLTTPQQRGVVVQNNVGTDVLFSNLGVINAAEQAFLSTGNDINTSLTLVGGNRLESASETLPVFDTFGDQANVAATVAVMSSRVPAGTNGAVRIGAGSTGFLSVTEEFLVGPPPGSPGTVAADVQNDAGAAFSVTVP
jgi:hypothetical protein